MYMALPDGPMSVFRYTLVQVLAGIQEILSSSEIDLRTYQKCESNARMLMSKHQDGMPTALRETEFYFGYYVKKLCMQMISQCGEGNLLASYDHHWQEYFKKCHILNGMFDFHRANESHYDNSGKVLDIERIALVCWKRYMIEPVKEKLHNAILKQISKHNDERHHDIVRDFMSFMSSYRYIDEILQSSGLCKSFETALFNETWAYIQQEKVNLLNENMELFKEEPEEFLRQLHCKLEKEHYQIHEYLPEGFCENVIKKCKEYLVIDLFYLRHGSCKHMFINEQWDDVHYLYTLLSQTEAGPTEVVYEFKEYIEEIHKCSMPQFQDLPPEQFLKELCNLHDRYAQIVADIFEGNMQLQSAVNNFCRDAVNSVKTPELLVSHCDSLLNNMSQSDADTREGIKQFATVFQYTDDNHKHVYQSLYSKHLARRLLQSGPISLHTERSMIGILKDKCGFEYTRKFQEMFKDILTSVEIMTEFSNTLNSKENELSMQLSIKILQPYAWPLVQNVLPCNLPFELMKPMLLFEQFYHIKFSGRKLTWMHSYSSAEVELLYLNKKYLVCLGNSYQLAVLLSFEEHDVISTEELATNTQLPEQELLRQLQSLVNAKLLVATSPVCDAKSVFCLNITFKSKHTTIRVKTIPKKSPQQDYQAVEKTLQEQRAFCVQACIVKNMKAEKVLQHNVLVEKVITQCRPRFLPTVSMMDKCIEKLIMKEYMEPTADAVGHIQIYCLMD